MKIKVSGWLKFLMECFVIYKFRPDWPSNKTARHELTLFRCFYIEWHWKTTYWD